jgi:hypothetical protein
MIYSYQRHERKVMYLNIVHLPGGSTRVVPSSVEQPFAVITRSRRFDWALVATFSDPEVAYDYVARSRREGSEWKVTPADPVRLSRRDLEGIRKIPV